MTNADEVTSMERVTDLPRLRDGGPAPAGAAVQAAESAARAAGVRVHQIYDLEGLDAVYRLYNGIWRPDPKNPPVTTELLRALTKAGNYVAGAFDDGELVGACVGFFGAPAGVLHSHIAGVSDRALGRSVGFALKLHQRAWALQQGMSVIEWTFDPLVRRNAYFNLVKLGAQPAEYLPNFYGGMNDTINGADDSDRLLVHWDLAAPAVQAACLGKLSPRDAQAERAAGAVVALDRSDGARPVKGSHPWAGSVALVAVPPDIEALRARDPDCARHWRVAVRETLGSMMDAGARVTGFDRAGWYVLDVRPQGTEEVS